MDRQRSNARERWERLHSARALLANGRRYAECVRALQRQYSVSTRQAKRYLADAREIPGSEKRPAAKTALSINIDRALLQRLRKSAQRQRRTVSAEVEVALRRHLVPDGS
jgi:hypothetical protein